MEKDGELVFSFDDILLPDSNVNEPESHGFVKFKVLPNKELAPLTTLKSPANIYFDFNPPITTNEVLNTINCYLLPSPIVAWKAPFLETDKDDNRSYQWFLEGDSIDGATSYNLKPEKVGNYSVTVTDSFTCSKSSESFYYDPVGISGILTPEATIYPNPFSDHTTIWFEKALENGTLVFYNTMGQEVHRINGFKGEQLTLKCPRLGKRGIYGIST